MPKKVYDLRRLEDAVLIKCVADATHFLKDKLHLDDKVSIPQFSLVDSKSPSGYTHGKGIQFSRGIFYRGNIQFTIEVGEEVAHYIHDTVRPEVFDAQDALISEQDHLDNEDQALKDLIDHFMFYNYREAVALYCSFLFCENKHGREEVIRHINDFERPRIEKEIKASKMGLKTMSERDASRMVEHIKGYMAAIMLYERYRDESIVELFNFSLEEIKRFDNVLNSRYSLKWKD